MAHLSKNFVLSLVGFLILMLSLPLQAMDSRFQVYGVNLSLPMTNDVTDQPIHDFYINVGRNHGVKVGSKLKVFRRLPTTNQFERYQYDLQVPVAEVELIHVEETVSVARMVKMLYPANRPVLDVPGIIIGDLAEIISDKVAVSTRNPFQEVVRGLASESSK